MKRIKHYLLFILLSLCSMTSQAYDFEVDGLYYNLVSASEKTCQIVGNREEKVEILIPNEVTFSGITFKIVSVKSEAFENQKITKLRFNEYITDIPERAFYNCTIGDMILSDKIASIGKEAFYGVSFNDLTIPPNVSEIWRNSFTTFKNLRIEDSNTKLYVYNEYPYYNPNCDIESLYLGRNLSSKIWDSSKNVKLGTGITEIGKDWYFICDTLVIPPNINYIASGSCHNIRHLVIEDGDKTLTLSCISTTNVGPTNSIQYGSIESLYLGRTISWERHPNFDHITPFSNLQYLTQLEIGPGAKYIISESFQCCPSLRDVSISNSLQYIGEKSFIECNVLQYLKINDCKIIEKGCFDNCKALVSLHIFGPTQINGFNGCSNLKILNIGENNAYINSGFAGCTKLERIGVFSQTPPSCSKSVFADVNKFSCKLFIPEGKNNIYQNANGWKDFLFMENSKMSSFIDNYSSNGLVNRKKVVELNSNQRLENYIKESEKDLITDLTIKGNINGTDILFIKSMLNISSLDLGECHIISGGEAYSKLNEKSNGYIRYVRDYYYTNSINTDAIVDVFNNDNIWRHNRCDLECALLNEKLNKLVLPKSLEELGKDFVSGHHITSLYCYSIQPPLVNNAQTFKEFDQSSCILYVPSGTKELYAQAKGWKDFQIIVEGTYGNVIAVQPTNENPQVKLAVEDKAQFQWYKYAKKTTGKNVDITDYLTPTSGWRPIGNSWQSTNHEECSESILSFNHSFNVGDILSFDWAVSSEEMFDKLQCYIGDELLFEKSGNQRGSFSYTFQAATKGKLRFVYAKDNMVNVANDNVQISNVKISSSKNIILQIPNVISGETKSTLTRGVAEYGDIVFCMVKLSDGRYFKTNEFTLTYLNFIRTQPTANNLRLELDTPDNGAKYQWFKTVDKIIKSKLIIPTSSLPYRWNESDCIWTSGNKGQSNSTSTMSAVVSVEAGDSICFDWTVSSEVNSDYFYIIVNDQQGKSSGEKFGSYRKGFVKRGDVSLEFKYTKNNSGNSGLDCATVSNLRIVRPSGFGISNSKEEIAIVGATNATLDKSLITDECLVYCVITLSDGRRLISDKVNVSSKNRGDVDGNGVADISDVNVLINVILAMDEASKYDGRADVTGDGVVDISDVNEIINIILGIN